MAPIGIGDSQLGNHPFLGEPCSTLGYVSILTFPSLRTHIQKAKGCPQTPPPQHVLLRARLPTLWRQNCCQNVFGPSPGSEARRKPTGLLVGDFGRKPPKTTGWYDRLVGIQQMGWALDLRNLAIRLSIG